MKSATLRNIDDDLYDALVKMAHGNRRSLQQQIMQILQSRRPHTDSIMNAMLPRLRAVTDSVRMEIFAVLTPEQATRLDSLMTEMRPRRGMMRGGPAGRRGPGEPPRPQF